MISWCFRTNLRVPSVKGCCEFTRIKAPHPPILSKENMPTCLYSRSSSSILTSSSSSRFLLSFSSRLHPFSASTSRFISSYHNNNNNKNNSLLINSNNNYPIKMKFTSSVLTLFALAGSSSAFAPVSSKPAFTSLTAYPLETLGEEGTESFRLQYNGDDGKPISPWHDIPLEGSKEGTYNMVVEIPKMTKAKMEVATKEENNPIAQDMKKGKLRDYHGPIFWNYGCLPQTWEDPNAEHPVMKCFGDDDPIDVVEIGGSALAMGSVKEVKALGVLAMIDDGELDWKVVAIATDDPLAEKYNDIDDVPAAVKDGIREWFRWYKTPDDKPLNSFGYDEKFLDVAQTKEIIAETNDSWKKLKADGSEKLWLN